jgi:hypothetical protein
LVTATVLWLAPAAARADIPPPDGYLESCTRAKREGTNEFCAEYSASYKDIWGCTTDKVNTPPDPSKCNDQAQMAVCCNGWIAAGWTYRCKTYGASAFKALWCRQRQATDPPKPDAKSPAAGDSKPASGDAKAPPAGESGCGIGGAASASPLVIIAVALLALFGRRRRG